MQHFFISLLWECMPLYGWKASHGGDEDHNIKCLCTFLSHENQIFLFVYARLDVTWVHVCLYYYYILWYKHKSLTLNLILINSKSSCSSKFLFRLHHGKKNLCVYLFCNLNTRFTTSHFNSLLFLSLILFFFA